MSGPPPKVQDLLLSLQATRIQGWVAGVQSHPKAGSSSDPAPSREASQSDATRPKARLFLLLMFNVSLSHCFRQPGEVPARLAGMEITSVQEDSY